jgi:glucose/arabinose dehydrogenase
MKIEVAFPNLSFQRMVHLAYSGADETRLFLMLQPGEIVVFGNDSEVASTDTFLDIRGRVNDQGNEEGLLGLAFDPAYEANGYFYVYYSAAGPRRSVISRFSVSTDDPRRAEPSSELTIMEVEQPYANHNGGSMSFGPDGYLYVGLGDGGLRGDPHGNGQDRSTLLGAILRIDVSDVGAEGGYAIPPGNPFAGKSGGARREVWAYGLRNPWRFTFDRETGDLWAGDVGQNRFEEVDLISPGLNYGWNIMEATHCFGGELSLSDLLRRGEENCEQEGLEPPVVEYGRDGGCSITGGYVYRGARLPALYGAYIYGDFCSGKIWALRHDGESVVEHRLIAATRQQIPAFGEGPSGELYILSFGGKIYRLERD